MKFLVFSLLLLFSCAPAVKQEAPPEKKDLLEDYRQELRKDFEDFLKRSRQIMKGS